MSETHADLLRRLADLYDQQAKLAGEIAALEMRLLPGNDAGILGDMTKAQIKRRGRASAAGKAKKSGSPIAIAITRSKWRTITAYAKRLGVGQPTLSRYISGSLSCPRSIAALAASELGVTDRDWPKGVVD